MQTPKIFISYSRKDAEFALHLAGKLKDIGADIWIDKLNVYIGSRWDREVEKALFDSKIVIVILTPSSIDSNNVLDEIAFALDNSKVIIPVIAIKCQSPYRLARIQHVDFASNYGLSFQSLIELIGNGKIDEKPQKGNSVLQNLLNAAQAGESNAMKELGWIYEQGKDVMQNDFIAMEWYRKAADAGNIESMKFLGRMYAGTRAVLQNWDKSFKWLNKAAEAGDIEAIYTLHGFYQNGVVVKYNISKAIELISNAAEMGHAQAMSDLSLIYEKGEFVKRDYDSAIEWLRKAVAANHPRAMYNMGRHFVEGKIYEKDYAKALYWYQKGANLNDSSSMYGLSQLYIKGWGVKKDLILAEGWLKKSKIEKKSFWERLFDI